MVAAVVMLYKKCEWFRNAVHAVINAVAGFFLDLWSNIQATWSAVAGWFQTNVIQPLVGFFSNLWANIVAVWQAAGSWFQDNVAVPIQNAFQAVSDFVRGIFNGLLGFVESMINSVIGAVNKFVGGFSGIVEKAASFLGVDWDGIAEVPEVTLPRLAKGGIVDNPTILEAGEAGTEAIIPLSELWGQMEGIFDNSISGLSDRIASLAEQMNAADAGSRTMSLSNLLDRFGGGNDDDGPEPDGGGPIYIYYQPQYHFESGAPDQDDLTNAEHISQEEFDRRMDRYLKDRKRKDF